jgi:hypothetical protein
MWTIKISRKNKLKYQKIQDLWSSFDVGLLWQLSQVTVVIIENSSRSHQEI